MPELYIVATPIGNLKDLTLRALEILKEVDVIACEDTRHSRRLLNAYDIHKTLISCRAANEKAGAEQIVRLLDQQKSVAYVSDAGSPGISDPGRMLVRTVRDAGYTVVPIPGVSAFNTLVSVCGFAGKSIVFDGFMPIKGGKRKKRLELLMDREDDIVVYESPYRIVKLLTDIADIDSERDVLIGREMTKMHEEFLEGPVKAVLTELAGREKLPGEFSVFISGKKKR